MDDAEFNLGDETQLDGLFFHEDEYCMWQILPAANIDFVKKQCDEAEAFSKEHLDEDGNFDGTDIMVLEEEPVSISTLNLQSSVVKNILKASMPEQTTVYSGTPDDIILCENMTAYGESDNCAFLLEEDNGIIIQLSMVVIDPTGNERKNLLQAFGGLCKIAELLYVDWYWHDFFALTDTQRIEDYLDARKEHLRKVIEEMEAQE